LLEEFFYFFPVPPNRNEKLTKPEINKFGNNLSSSTENELSENLSAVADSQAVHSSSILHYRYLP